MPLLYDRTYQFWVLVAILALGQSCPRHSDKSKLVGFSRSLPAHAIQAAPRAFVVGPDWPVDTVA